MKTLAYFNCTVCGSTFIAVTEPRLPRTIQVHALCGRAKNPLGKLVPGSHHFEFELGDRVVVEAPIGLSLAKRGMAGTVVDIDACGELTVEPNDGAPFRVIPEEVVPA